MCFGGLKLDVFNKNVVLEKIWFYEAKSRAAPLLVIVAF